MNTSRIATSDPVGSARQSAERLVAAMPRLVLEARRIAASVFHGLHGRRRAGPGENFWQYRRFHSGEPANRIDWRRSARDDHLYVREREWEAAHTVWIWPDRSPSMDFGSRHDMEWKLDRALVLAFALGELLVRGGERVGIPGAMRPTANRAVIDRMADAIIHQAGKPESLPPAFAAGPRDEVCLLGDFWSPAAEVAASFAAIAANGAAGHIVQVVDPAEETFPYTGRVQFLEPEGAGSITVGRAEAWRDDYTRRIALHREAIRFEARRHGWDFLIHRTDHPASEPLLALRSRMGQGHLGQGHLGETHHLDARQAVPRGNEAA